VAPFSFPASLLRGQRVRLEIQTSPTSRDRYGRLQAYVFRQSDNLLINKEIIRQGYGHAYTKYLSARCGWRSSGQRSGRRETGSGDYGDNGRDRHQIERRSVTSFRHVGGVRLRGRRQTSWAASDFVGGVRLRSWFL